MTSVTWGSKLAMGLLGSLICVLSGCVPLRRPVPAEALPRRVVLALDGLDYRDVMDARQRGRFAAFHAPARLVSTFPSISDIAWHAIFGVYPPAGYQRVYYSTRHNTVIGDALSAIRPIEYEERMDYAFDAKFHHLGAYIISWPTARSEVNTDVDRILRTRGRETVYLYNVGPDALQHTRGDVQRYLDHLDAQLTDLLARYRRRTGRELEVIVMSDHGHNRAHDAEFAPLVEALAAQGFETARSIAHANQVAFSVDGVTTGFGVFCAPDSVARVAALLVGMPAVELVSLRLTDSTFRVQRRDAAGSVRVGELQWRRAAGTEWFRYDPGRDDPLELAAVLTRMRAGGVLDGDGYAPARGWVDYTAGERFPVAPVRIVHGHASATRNPAPILVSLDDRYRVGLGIVSVANRLRPLGGTHGALGVTNAVGMVLSNVVVPHDDVAMHVREQFGGFDDLREIHVREPALAVVDAVMLRTDRLYRRSWAGAAALPDSGPVVVLSLPESPERWSGRGGRVRLVLETVDNPTSVHRVTLPLDEAARRADGTQWAWSASTVGLATLAPGTEYRMKVVLERVRGSGDAARVDRTKTLFVTRLRTALDGVPWSY